MPNENIIELYEGYRCNIHPKLEILDEIDCKVIYNRKLKFFHIEYDRDREQKEVVYRKAILSTDPVSINEMIQDFQRWKEEELMEVE